MSTARIVRLMAWREIRERGRSKAFVVSTLVSLGILLAVVVAAGVASDDDPTRYEVGVVGDRAAAVGGSLRQIVAAADEPFVVDVTELAGPAAAESRVEDGDLDAALVPTRTGTGAPSGDGPALEVVVDEDVDPQLGNLLHAANQVSVADTRGENPAGTLAVRRLHPVDPDEEDRDGLLTVGTVILYAQLLGFGFWVASGILEEKTSRVVELLLAKLPPAPLLTGKIVGIGLLGFVQLVGFVVVGLVGASVTGAIDLPPGTPGVAAQVLAWFVLGYVLYSCLFAMGGAIASRPEELQNTTMPVSLLAVVSFFVAFGTIEEPGGVVARIATYVPTAAPLVLPIRTATGAAAIWEVVAGVAIVLVSIVVVVRLTARVYAGAALFSRGPLKLREALDRARQ